MPEIKNFPHQYNDLRKLRRTVELHEELERRGADTRDDGIFGYALATARIYAFRNTPEFTPVDYDADDASVDAAIAVRIEEEKQKAPPSQGARTAAREMRVTMRRLGWLAAGGTLTAQGQRLLASAPGSTHELEEFRRSLMNLEVEDSDGATSHPVRILLKLTDQHRFATRDGMELALAAKDDSIAAYDEISELAHLPQPERQAALDATDSTMANAIKILPAFAIQAGLLARHDDGQFFVTPDGYRWLKDYAEGGTVTVGHRGGEATRPRKQGAAVPTSKPPRRADADSVARHREDATARRNLSAEEQQAAARLLLERTQRHNDLVRATAAHSGTAALYDDEFSYDLLMVPNRLTDAVILWEIKTIDGDSVAQVRRCSEQLSFYEYFHVRPHWPGRHVLRAAMFESAPDPQLCRYLQGEHRIAAFSLDDTGLLPLNGLAKDVVEHLATFTNDAPN